MFFVVEKPVKWGFCEIGFVLKLYVESCMLWVEIMTGSWVIVKNVLLSVFCCAELLVLDYFFVGCLECLVCGLCSFLFFCDVGYGVGCFMFFFTVYVCFI